MVATLIRHAKPALASGGWTSTSVVTPSPFRHGTSR
jgi:hypothetical protein